MNRLRALSVQRGQQRCKENERDGDTATNKRTLRIRRHGRRVNPKTGCAQSKKSQRLACSTLMGGGKGGSARTTEISFSSLVAPTITSIAIATSAKEVKNICCIFSLFKIELLLPGSRFKIMSSSFVACDI